MTCKGYGSGRLCAVQGGAGVSDGLKETAASYALQLTRTDCERRLCSCHLQAVRTDRASSTVQVAADPAFLLAVARACGR